MAQLEFYIRGNVHLLASAQDGAVPREGEFISIRKTTYKVYRVTWALDYADEMHKTVLRANVELEET